MDDMETNNGDREDMSPVMMASPPTTLCQEVWSSSELLFQSRITWLLVLGPVALLGDATGTLGEATCFALSGIALIPCAERYVTYIYYSLDYRNETKQTCVSCHLLQFLMLFLTHD